MADPEIPRADERFAPLPRYPALEGRIFLTTYPRIDTRSLFDPNMRTTGRIQIPFDQFMIVPFRFQQFEMIETISLNSRKAYWNNERERNVSLQRPENQYIAWQNRLISMISSKANRPHVQNLQTLFLALGIDSTRFTPTQSDILYAAYFSEANPAGSFRESITPIKRYAYDLLRYYQKMDDTTDRERIDGILPSILWFAGIFGEEDSAEIVSRLIRTESEAATLPSSQIHQNIFGNNAINTLSSRREGELLDTAVRLSGMPSVIEPSASQTSVGTKILPAPLLNNH
ncbi:hypothetical protein HGB07_00175 [Candidatus Roizmanbacteria bacterium]|nr:hypothetical protein [Candidatus Roizmanbacteria bacterium]